MSTAVLCVHGIQGSPAQFDWIIRALPEDVCVENILLPGHGSDVRAFSRSAAQWQACVDGALERLRGEHDRIVYIGHSMGCLLGIDAQLRLGCISSMILLACPLRVRVTARYLKNNLLAVSGVKTADPFVLAARSGHSVHAKYIWEYLLCVKPYIHLFQKIHDTNRRLSGLKLPVLAVFSERDEIVSRKSMERLASCIDCESYLARGCGHMCFAPEEQENILARIRRYL